MRSSVLPRACTLFVALGCIAALAGCAQSRELLVVDVPAVGESITTSVGPAGATLELAGVSLSIPPGALAETRRITVTATDAAPPSWLRASSPVLRFEPEGLSFARPIEVRIPFRGDPRTATIFWTAREGEAFVARATRIEGRVAITESTHFSQAVVGSACEGDDCCDQANGQLDVLLMVDNSSSMAEEQALLAAQIPRLARALVTGDSDDDGVQDFPALESVRVGVVSSDMGTAGYLVPTCDSGFGGAAYGDDGLLHTQGAQDGTCASSYPSFAEAGADSTAGELDDFVAHVSCVARLGVGGCGFEQQLESVLKALTPSTSSLRFHGDTTGHGDGANAGFLRDDSMLAVVMMTDENDCSASDSEILDLASATYAGVDLNVRCASFPDALHSTERYVDGLLALRDDPADVIFATVSGVPTDLAGTASFAAILDDPRMEEQLDPTSGTRLVPSCNVPGVGLAYPPRRIVEVARDLDDAGAHGVVASICQHDFTGVINAILSRVAARASGQCGS